MSLDAERALQGAILTRLAAQVPLRALLGTCKALRFWPPQSHGKMLEIIARGHGSSIGVASTCACIGS